MLDRFEDLMAVLAAEVIADDAEYRREGWEGEGNR